MSLFLKPGLVVEPDPGTTLLPLFSFVLCFNLPILASPRVLHREQRRKIPSACMGVRGRFYTPADAQRTRPGSRLCGKTLTQWHKSAPEQLAGGAGPRAPSALMVRCDSAAATACACSRAGCRPS